MLRRLLALALAISVASAALTVWSGPALAADESGCQPDPVTARLVEIDGQTAGEILVAGEVVLRIRAPLGTFSVEKRTDTVAARLSDAVVSGEMPYHYGLDFCEGAVILTAGNAQLVTVDSVTAAQAGGTPFSTAVIWLKNLRRALGWDPFVTGRSQVASRSARVWTGAASWYGPGFQGRSTASGEPFDMNDYTAAHRSLPFGTELLVTSLDTGLSVIVRVNDRGPFVSGRELDLSRAAASAIGLLGFGVARVQIDYIR